MNQVDRNKSILKKYIPEKSIDTITEWIYKYNFKLKVKKSRSSKEGDYMPPHNGKNHTITINHDLNKYAFLVTLIHEVAHLVTWEKYKERVNPHGKEWKSEYSNLLNYFLRNDKLQNEEEKLFPKEIFLALHKHTMSPSAASCSDLHLSRVLKNFDADSETVYLEKISAGSSFRIISSGRKQSKDTFIKGEKRRTRFKCIHTRTKREYLIHALCKVELSGFS
ncbi:MAG: SprT-like domain-containing protein [Bacteroidetes bacterium]|nr:SprT-like domain-containing protein [Bacteroidota bacterium]